MDRLANHFRLLDKLLGGKSKIPVGVSSCLVGDKVRYDGDHKHSVFITDTLGQYLQFNKFCPELEIGLGVPRKPIRLTKNKQGLIRCVQIGNGSIDVTDSLQDLADQQASWHQQLCGYIFKKGSPSCGLGNVKIWDKEVFEKRGTGIYAGKFIENFPGIPVIDEDKLDDPLSREDFLGRVISCWKFRNEFG